MRRISVSFLFACALAFAVSACGETESPPKATTPSDSTPADQNNDGTQNNTDGTDNNSDNGTSNNTGGACDRTGFPEGTATRAQAAQGGWMFEAADANTTEFMNIASFVDWQGPTAPGTYELTGINYKDCGLCLLAGTGCSGGSCQKMFYAHEGTVEITSVGTENGATIAGVLKNVVFEEVTVAGDYTTTKVANGSKWCFDDYAFSEVAIDPNAPQVVEPFGETVDSCVAEGNGTGIGNNINNLQLPNCNGETVSLHDGCSTAKAVWYIHTAGWCGACETWLPLANQLYQQEADSGLEVYYILGEDASNGVPTNAYCTQYAQAKGLDPARVLIDNSTGGPWGTFGQSINTYNAGYIPWNAVLRGNNMEYIWADNVSDGSITDLKAALDAALEKDVDVSVLQP